MEQASLCLFVPTRSILPAKIDRGSGFGFRCVNREPGTIVKIGAFLMVRDEEAMIETNLRYHLERQGLDHIIVIDNGSVDRTLEIVRSLQDERITIRRTPADAGYQQYVFSTQAAFELFDRYACNWVLPIDADEFWVSDRHRSVRAALESKTDNADVYYTWAYNFYESERDDSSENLFLRRLIYFRMSKVSKVVLRRSMRDKFQFLHTGNHDYEPVKGEQIERELVKPSDLVRYHYPYISREDTKAKVLKQVDGFVRAFGDAWLHGEVAVGRHILRWYRAMEAGGFEVLYKRTAYLTADQIADRSLRPPVHRNDTMRRWFRRTGS
ncbi:glycosyltransferase [bacterium]|nr:glycosyltransferase [bacterium]